MARDMMLRNGFPASVLDRDAGSTTYGLEPHLDFGDLAGDERRLPPGEGEADTRLPDGDAANLKLTAVRESFGETAAWTRLEGKAP